MYPLQLRPVPVLPRQPVRCAGQRQGRQPFAQARRKGRLLRERRPDPEQCVDALALGEAVPVKAEQAVQCAFGDAAQQAHLPALDRRGDREAGQRVAEVMLAVAIGSLTVFPGLAPGHAGQCQEATAGRQAVIQQRSQRRRQFAAHLQGMLVGTVVGEQRRRLQGTAGKQQVGFGGMQVAARRIDPQRPASAAGLLPGRQRQSVVEHLREAAAIEPRGRGRRPGKHPVVGWRLLQRPMQQFDLPAAPVLAERRRLGRPVQSAGTGCVALRAMHAEAMVGEYLAAAVAHVHRSAQRAASTR